MWLCGSGDQGHSGAAHTNAGSPTGSLFPCRCFQKLLACQFHPAFPTLHQPGQAGRPLLPPSKTRPPPPLQAASLRTSLEQRGRELAAAEDHAARHGIAVSGSMSAEVGKDPRGYIPSEWPQGDKLLIFGSVASALGGVRYPINPSSPDSLM